MNRPMTATDKERARRDYVEDPSVSYRELADEYGVSASVMLRALAGITRPRGGVVKATLTTQQMMRLRDAGLTMSQIARQAGITESGVSRRLSSYGNREAS